ncbi:MAG: amidohydrolase family protein [Planctomycetota bacterium]
MIYDCHVPVYDENDYSALLAETVQNLGFEKVCIRGGSARYGLVGNEGILECAAQYPSIFMPAAYIDPGVADPRDIEAYARQDFVALWFEVPRQPYDTESYYPLYATAQATGMPAFFRTGYMPATAFDRALGIKMNHMRPTSIDTIARHFPDLPVIGTGLGGPWYEEAAAALRHNDNLMYELGGTQIARRNADFFRTLLGPVNSAFGSGQNPAGLWSKIIFGTGVHYDRMAAAESDYQRLLRSIALPDDVVSDIMHANFESLFGDSEVQ